MKRRDGRSNDELRKITVDEKFITHPEGAILISFGKTKVLCTASVDESVPNWLEGTGQGWVHAEYNMLPRATHNRARRERGRIGGRTQEIQRLIGRSLRGAVDLRQLGERQIIIDCDVIQADGGTRTAAISGGFIALSQAIHWLQKQGRIVENPMMNYVAAISVGIVGGELLLDLCYEEDSSAEVDMNIVMNDEEKFIEVQGTAEEKSFTQDELIQMLNLASKGIDEIFNLQNQILEK